MDLSLPNVRFRLARERSGLSPDQVAAKSGISSNCIWDIETHEDELSSCYSPIQLQLLCRAIGNQPVELFGAETNEPPISALELIRLINEECDKRKISLKDFDAIVGWRLSACIEPPEKLFSDITLDGLRWLGHELHIDWRRVLLL